MPFDGIVTKAVADELNSTIAGGRINKIYQPQRDTLVIHIRSKSRNEKLLLSCNANSARIHLTDMEYENPASPPMFCMLLRKHLCGGTILSIEFHNYERILDIFVEAVDELGDRNVKKLIIEIMGRHSNIILLNPGGIIIDAMKHVDHDINRVREIMPARPYAAPPSQNKTSPAELNIENFIYSLDKDERPIAKTLLSGITGFSPVLCREICMRAGVEPDLSPKMLEHSKLVSLITILQNMADSWNHAEYNPCVVMDTISNQTVDFHAISLTQHNSVRYFESISKAVDFYFRSREAKEFIKNKSTDLIRVIRQNIERCEKKIQIHVQTIEESSSMKNYRLYGELITANIHALSKGMKRCCLLNYYDPCESCLEISLDENLTPQENAQRYFRKYNKAKTARTFAEEQLKLSRKELDYLENVMYNLEEANTTDSIEEIREELRSQGYVHKTNSRRKKTISSSPYSFITTEGYQVWVGRNNLQNDELTLKHAKSGDMWLHTKNIPGSHVIARIPEPIPDTSLLEAANLAAWFSKARFSSKVEVDYTRVKNVKKPSGSKPGMVIYVQYNTIIVDPKNPGNIQ